MKTVTCTFLFALFLLCTLSSFAQSDPGTTNLMHQWTFDDGTANDGVPTNPVHGTCVGGAYIANKALVLTEQGQYLSFSGADLALNTYQVISQEIWFTSQSGANSGFAHLAYFGRTVNNNGSNYLFMMPARGDNESRTAISSDAGLNDQVVVRGPEYDDGELHQFISVVRSDSLFFYIDGKLVDKTKNTIPLSAISTSLAYLGKSGFTADPTWIGSISKFSIYNTSLSPAEVAFLYDAGAENNPAIITSDSVLSFHKPGTQKVAVWALNLEQDISISAPEHFSLSSVNLDANIAGDSLAISYLGSANTEGYITLSSGNTQQKIFVQGTITPNITVSTDHIILDEFTNTAEFTVDGNNLHAEIHINAPEGVSLSQSLLPTHAEGIKVRVSYDGMSTVSGTIELSSDNTRCEIVLTAQPNSECFVPILPENLIIDPTLNYLATGAGNTRINTNPEYVYCGTGSGEASENGTIERNLSGILKPDTEYRVRAKVYKNHPRIKQGNMGAVTYTLAVDSAVYPTQYQLIKTAMDSACAYFNTYTPFVEDIYVYYNDGIPTAQASHLGSIGFGSNTSYMWVGTAIHEMAHYFGSGTSSTWQSLMSDNVWSGEAGSDFMRDLKGETLKGDSQHYWPLGINYKSEITNLGSQDAQHTELINAVKLIKAMLVDDCKYPTYNSSTGIGISGHASSSTDIFYEAALSKTWETIDCTFTTGANIGSNPNIYFTSNMGYVDNWELYEVKDIQSISIPLSAGWNMISLPVAMVDMSIRKLFPHATIVKNQSGFFSSSQSVFFNSLDTIEPGKGYVVYNSIEETLHFEGYELNNASLHISDSESNWQLMGFPQLNSTDIETGLEEYILHIETIKNFEGFWHFGNTNNSINNLEPGKAYFVKMQE
ncbi:MAG: LamG-like jellyroll fold domain-containing protein [Bacteroidales bacterium]